MKLVIVAVFAMVAVAVAAPSQDFEQNPEGSKYAYDTANGMSGQDTPVPRGSYSYAGDQGEPYSVNFPAN